MHLELKPPIDGCFYFDREETINRMPVSEKLVRGNHTLWKAQILVVL
jgi:hypothetical protein